MDRSCIVVVADEGTIVAVILDEEMAGLPREDSIMMTFWMQMSIMMGDGDVTGKCDLADVLDEVELIRRLDIVRKHNQVCQTDGKNQNVASVGVN